MVDLAQRKMEELEAENKRLELRVQMLERELYGSRSDKRPKDDGQQETFPGIDANAEGSAPESEKTSPSGEKLKVPARKERKGKKKGPKPLNPNLERVDETIADPDLNDLICPITGQVMKRAFEEKIEVLARRPAQYYVRVLRRWVYASPSGDALSYSPWPTNVMPKSRIDVSVVANLLTSRFADHQPYYRLNGQYQRHEVSIAESTMVSLVKLACQKLEPIYKKIAKQVIACGYIMMDPTPVRLKTDQKKGSTKEAAMWTYRALDGPVFFEFATSKSGETPKETLKDYQGILHTDGASNFGGVPTQAGVTALNCWAHLRRYYLRSADAGEPEANAYLDRIDRLFYIERLIRRFPLQASDVLELRKRHSLPLVDALFEDAIAATNKGPLLKTLKTPFSKAVKYTIKRTQELRECFLHAPSRIDTNPAENALRPIKLGAKNWLFIGHSNAGPRAAQMFTLIENCRMLGVNPEAYLIDVLTRIDEHPNRRIDELTPHGWSQIQQQSQQD
jgi:transposase